MKRIAIATSSFDKNAQGVAAFFRRKEFTFVFNTTGTTMVPEAVVDQFRGCVGIIAGTEKYTKDILDRLPGLKVISRCGAGLDSVDVAACHKKGIKVFNTPDAPTQAVAELVIGLILNLLRHVTFMDHDIRAGRWNKRMGQLMSGKNLGVIGMGRIGRAVAKLTASFGANVLYFDPAVKSPKLPRYTFCPLNDLLAKSDIVTIHVPGAATTQNMIGQKEFALMKKGAYLINCSRGGVVNEKALYENLKNGWLAGAAVDVFDAEPYQGPLTELENVILTPHIGSYAVEARQKMEEESVLNLLKGLQHTR